MKKGQSEWILAGVVVVVIFILFIIAFYYVYTTEIGEEGNESIQDITPMVSDNISTPLLPPNTTNTTKREYNAPSGIINPFGDDFI